MIALDELTGGEVSVVLKPGMAWAIYLDDGPGGPCAQSMRTTLPHGELHIWPNEDLMREDLALGRNKRARVMCGVVGEWTFPGVFSIVKHGEFGGSNEVTRAYSAPEEDRPLLPPWEKDA